MKWINETYTGLLSEVHAGLAHDKSRISRKKTLKNGIDIILSISKNEMIREFCIRIQGIAEHTRFPQWRGIDIAIQKIAEYGQPDALYLVLVQNQDTRAEIFEYVANDITERIQRLDGIEQSLACSEKALVEWKHFFDNEAIEPLSSTKIQGLFGELLFLKELIQIKGDSAVSCWVGSNAEQHDFYIGSNAVEVKTTATKSPYVVQISSEYQLDPVDVEDLLFLRVYPLRKSESSGSSINRLIKEVKEKLCEAPSSQKKFLAKLEKAGYHFHHAPLYENMRYTIRDAITFEVSMGFPSIRRSTLASGLNNIRYSLNTDICHSFICSSERLHELLLRR